jgi:CheY-like chemotaxis protein
LGQGSEFHVHLPVVSDPAQSPPERSDEVLTAERVRRVLIVDDVKDNADSLAALLKALGHQVHAVYDGAAAIEVANTVRPEVVLLDLGMPGMDGFEVCRQLRRQSWGKTTLIVALTGWGQEGDRVRTEDAGFDHHIIKPAELNRLTRLLHAANRHH